MTGQNQNSHYSSLNIVQSNVTETTSACMRHMALKKKKQNKITRPNPNDIVKYLFLIRLTFSSVVHSISLPFKYFSTVVQLKSGAYLVDGMELRPLVNSNRLLHLSCLDKYRSSSASIMIILFFSTFLASNMTACFVRRQIVCFILGGHLCCIYIKQTHDRHSI